MVTFRREYGSSGNGSNYNDGNAAMSGMDVEKPPEQSLESISNQKSLRVLKWRSKLRGSRSSCCTVTAFAFAHFSDISLQASSARQDHRTDTNATGSPGTEM